MDYPRIDDLLLKLKSAYESIGAETELVAEKPAGPAEDGRKEWIEACFADEEDDGERHGYILGKDFDTYFEQLLKVGACGNEDWQILPFCPDAQSGIVSDCENEKGYRRVIGLQI